VNFPAALDPIRSIKAVVRAAGASPGPLLAWWFGGLACLSVLGLLFYLPAMILMAASGMLEHGEPAVWVVATFVVLVALYMVAMILGQCVWQIGLATLLVDTLRTGRSDLARAWAQRRRVGALVRATLLVFGLSLLAYVPFALGALLLAWIGEGEPPRVALVALAVALAACWMLVVWYIFLGLLFVNAAVSVDECGALEAVRRSWSAARGHRLALLWLLFVTTLAALSGVLLFCIGYVFTIALAVLVPIEAYVALTRGADASRGGSRPARSAGRRRLRSRPAPRRSAGRARLQRLRASGGYSERVVTFSSRSATLHRGPPMRFPKLFLVVGLAVLPFVAHAAVATQTGAIQPGATRSGDAERLIALGKSDSRVMEPLDHLANRIGPRLTGSDGLINACDWARAEFERIGLSNARLEKWGEFPVGFNRGPATGHMLTPEPKELHFATNAWTAGTQGRTVGHVVIAPADERELEALRPKLKGAWVFAAPTPPRARAGANTPAPVEAGTARPERGANAGAPDRAFRDKLAQVYTEAGVLGTVRSGRGELLLTDGNSRVRFDQLPKRPAITLLAAEYEEIVKRVKAGETVTLAFDIRNWFEQGPIDLHNVIGEIPGSEKPDEVVIVGGHIDSWDGATGATDNGTGCATTIEAARLLIQAGVKPKRTIRFMLWSGEEQGLLGSAAYVKAHQAEMAKVSAVLVHDGGTNYCAGITATPTMLADLQGVFAPVTQLDPELPFQVREVKGLSSGGSDHASFLAAGVPGFFWSQRGRANYNHTHHTQFDTYDAAIPEYQVNSSIVIAVGALGIANLPGLLSRENLRAAGGGGGRRLGVQLGDDMSITEVVEDGLAAKAGLLVGDKIVKIGAVAVGDSDEMRSALREGPAKTTVVVQRQGKEQSFAIEFPGDAGGPGAALGRRLGVRFGEGLTLDVITPGGSGDQAGLVVGDKLVRIGDTPVATAQEAAGALADVRGSVKVAVQRDGRELVVTLPLP